MSATHSITCLGYTCVNDVSANELTNSDIGAGMSLRWKHFDTFCPLGPVIATDIDGDNLRIQCRVNGETQVDGNSVNMLWGVAELVSWVSDVMTLYPGDIIPSGCPGVDEINIGDVVEVEVEGIGILRNPGGSGHRLSLVLPCHVAFGSRQTASTECGMLISTSTMPNLGGNSGSLVSSTSPNSARDFFSYSVRGWLW